MSSCPARGGLGCGQPGGKLTTIIAGMMCGADSIDDANVLRAGGTPRVFNEVYAPSTVGIAASPVQLRQPARSPRGPRASDRAAARTGLLAGADERMFVDIDSLLRPVWAPETRRLVRHAKIAGVRCCARGCPR